MAPPNNEIVPSRADTRVHNDATHTVALPLAPAIKADKLNDVVTDYKSLWSENNQADQQQSKERTEQYEKITNTYYDLATDFYEYGWGTSFHFANAYKGESLTQAIARHEHYLAMQLGLRAGMKVLDVGCGVGGPLREIARFSGAHITGLNNNEYQVRRASVLTARAGLQKVAGFIKGDFMNIEYTNHFDAVYAIEATCHAPSLAGVYGQMFKALKPGGMFAVYEWVMTDRFDNTNPDHLAIKRGIEIGDGIANLVTAEEARAAAIQAGFELISAADVSEFMGEVPWYEPLSGSFSLQGFSKSILGRYCTDTFLRVFEAIGLAPKGSRDVSQLLIRAADSLVAGGKLKLFTPMFLIVGRKPAN